MYCCVAYICEGISILRIYVTVTSPYPRDQGVKVILRTTFLAKHEKKRVITRDDNLYVAPVKYKYRLVATCPQEASLK